MALQQSIDLALAANIGEAGLPQTALDAARAGVASAAKRLAEDDAGGRLPLLRHAGHDRRPRRDPRGRRRGCATAPRTSSSSAPADRASAARRWRSSRTTPCRASGASPRRRACISSTTSTRRPSAALLERLPLATTRFVAISKSGGTGETLMQAIAVLSALDKAGFRARAGELFLGLSEPRREGAPERPARPPRARGRRLARASHRHRRALFGADQCRPPAGRRPRPRHRRDPRRRRRRLRSVPRRRGRPMPRRRRARRSTSPSPWRARRSPC